MSSRRARTGKLASLAGNDGGTALLEFAFALPVLLVLYGGSIQISDAISCNRKVTIATRTVADLVAQNTIGSTSASEVDSILAASTQVMSPYDAKNAMVRISEVTTDANLNSTVYWSRALNGDALRKGSSITLPANMRVPGSHFLLADVQYSYSSAFNFGFVKPSMFGDQIYMVPRNTATITCSDC